MAISFNLPKIESGFMSELKKDKVFWLLIWIILLLLVVFLGLKVYNTQLKGQISLTEEQILELNKEKDEKLEKEMEKRMPLLEKAKIVLDSHTRAKNVFDLIEKKTFDEVQINSLVFNAKENTVIISAESSSDKALSIQNSIFKSTPDIKSVEMGGVSKEEGLFKFQFKLTLDGKLTGFSYKIK